MPPSSLEKVLEDILFKPFVASKQAVLEIYKLFEENSAFFLKKKFYFIIVTSKAFDCLTKLRYPLSKPLCHNFEIEVWPLPI